MLRASGWIRASWFPLRSRKRRLMRAEKLCEAISEILLLFKMILVTLSSSVNESDPIRCISFPVMMIVLAYPGILCGNVVRSVETHLTVRVIAKHSQPKGHSRHWQGAQSRIPKNTDTTKMHMFKLQRSRQNTQFEQIN